MNRKIKSSLQVVTLGLLLGVGADGAFAEKPDRAGGGKPDKQQVRKGQGDQGRADADRAGSVSFRFSSGDRRIVGDYFGAQIRKGDCPPGLAKKNNGCQPPGLAKQWRIGQPLGKDITYYELPRELVVRLPVPPVNHRYVRVAEDILMIAVGTSLVVDALEDITR